MTQDEFKKSLDKLILESQIAMCRILAVEILQEGIKSVEEDHTPGQTIDGVTRIIQNKIRDLQEKQTS
jgi:hypothetical protein